MSEKPKSIGGNAGGEGPPGASGWLAAHGTSVAVTAAVLAAFFAGYVVRGCGVPGGDVLGRVAEEEAGAAVWICPMNNVHSPVIQDKPGKCPHCGMDLVRTKKDSGEEKLGPRQIRLSDEARALAQVRVSPVERRFVEAEVRMAGKVEYDETRVAHITARVGGRIDDLYADYTGVSVEKGEHLFQVYSPEILAAQEELLQAIKAEGELRRSSIESVRRTATATVQAAREKLRLWGLSPKQVQEFEARGTAADHITVNSPLSGVVVVKQAVEGMYVKTGAKIYTIVDLSQVWVKLDAYESDLPWIRYGQTVEFRTDAFPGETFEGKIAFIAPVLDERSRTVKVRVNVPNESGRLKPGMFVTGLVRATVTADGRAMEPDLAGKAKPPLVIPASAPLITGRRAVVYVDLGGGVFEGREVVLGPRAGDHYVVREGLEEGEKVVTNGNFKIDSAIQILGKRSMMSPAGGPAPGHHRHGATAGSENKERGGE